MKILIGAALGLTVLAVSPVQAQRVVTNPGYCAQFYPNANCQNYGPGNPYTGVTERGSGTIPKPEWVRTAIIAVIGRANIGTTAGNDLAVRYPKQKPGEASPGSLASNVLLFIPLACAGKRAPHRLIRDTQAARQYHRVSSFDPLA